MHRRRVGLRQVPVSLGHYGAAAENGDSKSQAPGFRGTPSPVLLRKGDVGHPRQQNVHDLSGSNDDAQPDPSYTIGNQLEEAILRHRYKVSRREARDRAVFLLDKVGIPAAESRLGQYPHQLSGGLRQRVMIAMALMCEPELLIADEPSTALDVTIQAQILLLIRNLQEEFNIGVILITHDLGVVARVADRVAVMYAGEIVETGAAREVFEHPLHPYTQGLLDCIPVPGKTRPGQHLGSIPGIIPNLIGDLRGCTFHDRCTFAQEACTVDIDLHSIGPGRAYRCILPPEVEARKTTRTFGTEHSNAAVAS